MEQRSLFTPEQMVPIPDTGWRTPDEFPRLDAAKLICIDTETKDPHLKEKGAGDCRGDGHIVGLAVGTDDGHRWYFPMRHEVGGGNMNPAMVMQWAKDELGRVHQPKVGANLLYDLGWLATEGVEVKGPLIDVQYAEPLLNEHAFSYALENLGRQYLGEGKSDEVLHKWLSMAYGGPATRKAQAKNYYRAPARLMGPYAEGDVDLPLRIWELQKVQLEQEGLTSLFEMECKLIPMLLAMRRRGVRVDLDKANAAKALLDAKRLEAVSRIKSLAGVRVDIWAAASIAQAFDKMGISYPTTPKSKAPSFTATWLENHQSELAGLVRQARKMDKAKGTFIDGYIFGHQHESIIHASFHPLRSDDGGTVSGRFASSDPNLQNISAHDPFLGPLIRGLFVPHLGDTQWRVHDWCLTGDTLIQTDRGSMRMDEVVRTRPKVLSIVPNTNALEYKDVVKSTLVGVTDVYEIVLEDGSKVRATGDHKWLSHKPPGERGFDWIMTKELTPGISLGHVFTNYAIDKGRAQLSFRGNQHYRAHLVIEAHLGKRPVNYVDHIDGNRGNDDYHNLQYLTSAENLAQGGQRYWKAVKLGERSDENRLVNLRHGLEHNRRSYIGEGNPNYGKKRPGVGGRPFLGTVEHCPICCKEFKRQRTSSKKYCSLACYSAARSGNHKVVSIRHVGKEPVYQITVADNHNYVLENGLVSANCQIEYKLLAHYARGPGSSEMRQRYISDPTTDYHKATQEIIRGLTGLDLGRKPTKCINFGLVYGMGQAKLGADLGLTKQKSNEFFSTYHEGVPFVQSTTRAISSAAAKRGYLTTLLGRRARFPFWEPADWNLRDQIKMSTNKAKVEEAVLKLRQAIVAARKAGNTTDPVPRAGVARARTHKAANALFQGGAADIMKKAMVDIWESGVCDVLGAPLAVVHDEVDWSDPGTTEAAAALKEAKHIMETCVELRVPMTVDEEIGSCWGDAEEV